MTFWMVVAAVLVAEIIAGVIPLVLGIIGAVITGTHR